MKLTSILLIILSILILGCNSKTETKNQFSSENDTLIITTEKVKGIGMFPAGAGQIHFETENSFIDYPLVLPENISDIKIGLQLFDFKPWKYDRYKKGETDKKYVLKDISEGKIDTLISPSMKENSICILSGIKDGKKVFILDENNNQNFKDDSVRLYKKMDWFTTDDLIKCKYNIYNGEKIIRDSTWVNIGMTHGDNLLFFVSHHLIANIKIDNNSYQIGLVDDQSNFWFEEPLVALLSENETKKDTILKSDLLRLDEYIKLGDNYYAINKIANDGSKLSLIKENHFNSKIGTQVGMIAPDFQVNTYNGDTLSSAVYKNEILLLANISGCTGSSYNEYRDILKAKNAKLNVVGINSGVTKDLGGIMVDVENEFNKNFYIDYRNAYSSYDCFLINRDGRIIDKFDVFDWKKHLAEYIDKHE